MLRPASFRRTIAIATSKIGIAQTATGAARAIVAASLKLLCTATNPNASPISMLPASPRKIFAGGKLKNKKASRAPTRLADTRAVGPPNGLIRAIAQKAVPRITPTVLASPSIPSRRFTALIAPSRKKAVNGPASRPSSTV